MQKTHLSVLSAVMLVGLQTCTSDQIPPPQKTSTPDQTLAWIAERIETSCNRLGLARGSEDYDRCFWWMAALVRADLGGGQLEDASLPDFFREPVPGNREVFTSGLTTTHITGDRESIFRNADAYDRLPDVYTEESRNQNR